MASMSAIGWRAEAAQWRQPWKLVSFAAGLALLIAGSFHYHAPDWDVPVSILMAMLAYLTAPWSMRTMIERRWRDWPQILFLTWLTVDGGYALYWHFRDPAALAMMRDVNFPASLSLYWICGLLWLPRGSLAEIVQSLRNARRIR
jgi:hypothetical protein